MFGRTPDFNGLGPGGYEYCHVCKSFWSESLERLSSSLTKEDFIMPFFFFLSLIDSHISLGQYRDW